MLLTALVLTACARPVRSPGLDTVTVEPTLGDATQPPATEPVATEQVPATMAQSQIEAQMGREPILNFQDQEAACDDLSTNGAEWAFVVTTAPRAGNRVQSGFHARGCANVFEAALVWRLRDGQDAVLAEGHGMASCGTGCVGTFDLVVDYPARDAPGIGYLEVYAESAEDGRPVHVNRIPLILE